MLRSVGRAGQRRALAALAATCLLTVAACSSDGEGPSLPSLSTTTSTADGSTTTSTAETTTTSADSSTSSSTSTTEAPTTTTEASTTTTAERTTTTGESPTTAGASDEVAAGGTDDGSTSSAWLWIVAIALLVLAAAIALVALGRSRANARRQWVASARQLGERSRDVALTLDRAAATIPPEGTDRRVWFDADDTITDLVARARALEPGAPPVPGDPEGTNSLAAGLEQLRTGLVALQRSAQAAERTRYELLNPTTEQLEDAAGSVRQASTDVIDQARNLQVGLDRVAPPTPATPATGRP
jgi:DNA-directed RNA polymerase subunit K/omega